MIIIKPKINFILLISVISAGVCLFAYPEITLEGAKNGVNICLNSLIPSLFPFMALSTFIMRTDALHIINKFFGKVTKLLFLLPENACQIIFMSLIGGYPVGAKLTADALKNNRITENEAKRLCIFCMNAGPAFTVTAIGVNIYKSAAAGVIIFVSLCASSLVLGVLTRFLADGKIILQKNTAIKNFSSEDITFSVWDAFESTLKICAWVILFSAFLSPVTAKLGQSGKILGAVAEVTAGSITVSKICPIPVVTALCGFGGFCVHCQVLKFLRQCTLQYKLFFVGRILNSAISAVICHIILYYIPIEQSVVYTFESARISALSVSLPTVIAFIFMFVTMVLNIEKKNEMC